MEFTQNKIGDYIHYKYNNYLWYGIGKENDDGIVSPPDPNMIFRTQRKIIQNEVKETSFGVLKKQKRQELETMLNYFWDPTGDFNKLAQKFQLKQDELLAQILKAVQEVKFNKYDFNFTTNLGVENLKQNGGFGKFNSFKDFSMIYLAGIEERLSKALAFRNKLGQEANSETWSNWTEQLSQLQQEWRQIKDSLTSEQWKKSKVKIDTIPINNLSNFVSEVNNLIEYAKSYSAAHLIGQIGELAPVIIGQLLKQKTYNTLSDLISDVKKVVSEPHGENLMIKQVGFDASAALMAKENFAISGVKNDLITINNQHYFRHFGQLSADFKQTQDKVDIVINMEDKSTINASIKNYNLANKERKEISLLSGKNLLFYLQEYHLFLNHYLNITAYSTFSRNTAFEGAQVDTATLYNANKTLIYSLALKALVGGVLKGTVNNSNAGKFFTDVKKSDIAPVMIINDNSGQKGHYKVYFADDFISLLYSHFNTLETYVKSNIPYDKQWHQYYVTQYDNPYKNAYARIEHLLRLISQYPVKIEVPKSALDVWYNQV